MDHQQIGRKQTASSPEAAMASQVFDQFCNATTLKSILGHFRQLCELLKIKPNTINQFYPKLKAKLHSWKAQALWKKFDQRANHKCYNRGKACPITRVLIIGGGPCGLRSAIEAQLLGAKVVVVEKRDRMSRNNVLHLWPFVIHDLRGLGAKKFFGKFCAGSIDHISIRQLQCILLKVALILGVEFYESVSFDSLIPPPENQEDGRIGWRARTTPVDHPVSQYEFDVLIGADGKRNTLEGFKRKEFRGKLAIAITANFINKRTEAEARVEEISGVAFIFNQKFFKELYQETGIDLENIVYYKDDTHYFVMTAKKHSLIDKGVILQDHADTAKLLAKENVDREALMLYAREAAEFSTEYQMMDMEFAVNHYGQPDVAMFDFTSMYAAENASRVLERYGHRLLMILVGDSLLEPFWPTGSGCARGFLSSLDACWAIKGWGASMSPLEVIAERESIYRLLGQTTPENLNRDYAAYTLDPHTRYPNLNVRSVTPIQVQSLFDTDDPENIKQPVLQSKADIPKKRRRRYISAYSQVHPDTLLRWLQKQVALYDTVRIEDMGASFKDGLAICAIIHRYRPDLIDFHSLRPEEPIQNNQLAFDILEKELDIPSIMTGEEMVQCDVPDKLAMFSYLTHIYEAFCGEIPHIKHPKLESEDEERPKQLNQLTPEQKVQLIGRIVKQDITRARHSRSRHSNENTQPHVDKKGDTINRRSRKRRSTEKMGATVEERQKRLEDIEKNRVERMKKRQYLRKMATQQFYKSMQMLQANAKREKDEPFEDYSIFLYRQTAPDFKDRVKYLEQKILYPDREPKIHAGCRRGSIDEEFSGRIKNIEDKLKGSTPSEKKPRDLLRAIGKIEKTDWNVKEIEKKIEESKMGRGVRHEKVERVPKWSREQFLARQIKMEKKGQDQKETDSKYADIDSTLKNIDKKIKEGNVLGYNKVSVMAEQFSNKNQDAEPKVQKSSTKVPLTLPIQGGSEMCHFCNKRVYLMERLSAEGKFFHRGCFRCEYCSTSLRIGNHAFDREKEGGRFYCTQHLGLSGTMKARIEKKIPTVNKENIPTFSANVKTPEKPKIPLEGVVGLDLLDRGQTPERIEFENLAGISDAEEAQSQMDEDEWTDRNFGASTAEMGSSDDISDMSDSDEDNEAYEEAIDQPLTTEGTLELAKNWTLRYSHPHAAGQSDTGSNEYEDSSDEYTSEDDESGTATEDEEDARARELRRQEVWLMIPPRSSDTDTDSGSQTEVNISQDFKDTLTQDSTVLSQSTSMYGLNVVPLPLPNINDNENIFSGEVNGNKEEQNFLNLNINSDMLETSKEVQNNAHTVGKDTSRAEAYGSVIQSPNLNQSTTNPINSNIINTRAVSVPDRIVNNHLNVNDNKEDWNSEYESFVEDDIPDIHPVNVITNELKDMTNSNNVPISDNIMNKEIDDIFSDLNKNVVALNNEPSIPAARTLLPDAVPRDKYNEINTLEHNMRTGVNIDENLPDLITSSPEQSRYSTLYSSSDGELTETYNESVITKSANELLTDSECRSVNENEIVEEDDSNISKENKSPLKISIKMLDKSRPIITVTSPSPTNEISSDDLNIEATKLTIPKEVRPQQTCDTSNSSFDKLKRDLKLRKAKNKAAIGELKPLSKETAQLEISKYFTSNKSRKVKSNQNIMKSSDNIQNIPDIETVDLNIKSRLSDKVKTEDIMKYFNQTNSKVIETSDGTDDINECQLVTDSDVYNKNNSIDKNDIEDINQQFSEIEQHLEDTNRLENNEANKEIYLPELINKDNRDIGTNLCVSSCSLDEVNTESLETEVLLDNTNIHTNVKPKMNKNKNNNNFNRIMSSNDNVNSNMKSEIAASLSDGFKYTSNQKNTTSSSDNTIDKITQLGNMCNITSIRSKSLTDLKNSTLNLPTSKVKISETEINTTTKTDGTRENTNNTNLENAEKTVIGEVRATLKNDLSEVSRKEVTAINVSNTNSQNVEVCTTSKTDLSTTMNKEDVAPNDNTNLQNVEKVIVKEINATSKSDLSAMSNNEDATAPTITNLQNTEKVIMGEIRATLKNDLPEVSGKKDKTTNISNTNSQSVEKISTEEISTTSKTDISTTKKEDVASNENTNLQNVEKVIVGEIRTTSKSDLSAVPKIEDATPTINNTNSQNAGKVITGEIRATLNSDLPSVSRKQDTAPSMNTNLQNVKKVIVKEINTTLKSALPEATKNANIKVANLQSVDKPVLQTINNTSINSKVKMKDSITPNLLDTKTEESVSNIVNVNVTNECKQNKDSMNTAVTARNHNIAAKEAMVPSTSLEPHTRKNSIENMHSTNTKSNTMSTSSENVAANSVKERYTSKCINDPITDKTSNMQSINTPEVPMRRRKNSKRKSNSISLQDVSSSTNLTTEKLTLTDSNKELNVNIPNTSNLSTNKIDRISAPLMNTSLMQKNKHPVSGLPTNKSDVYKSTKSLASFKSDHSKKDKCTIS